MRKYLGPLLLLATTAGAQTLLVPNQQLRTGQSRTIPIIFEQPTTLQGADFEVRYSPEALKIDKATLPESFDNCLVAKLFNEGSIKFSIACMEPHLVKGELLRLQTRALARGRSLITVFNCDMSLLEEGHERAQKCVGLGGKVTVTK